MTEYVKIPIDQIRVDESRRQREFVDEEHVKSLAESIKRIGMIHAPVVDQNMFLVSGEHRYLAAKLLGWKEIDVQFRDNLTESETIAIGLEENVRRSGISWQEQARTIKEYHDLQKAHRDKWTTEYTGEALGMSVTHVKRFLQAAAWLSDEEVANANVMSAAISIITRKERRAQDELSAKVEQALTLDVAPVPTKAESPKVISDAPFICADFTEWVHSYRGELFNFIHCDFPYGINMNKWKLARKAVKSRYDDDEDVLWALMDTLAEAPIANSAHMIFWFSPKLYEPVKLKLIRLGWKVDNYPLIWMKTDNSGIISDRYRSGRRIYEMAFMCTRGDRYIVRPVANAIGAGQPKDSMHPSEKSLHVLRHFFTMFVDDKTVMLDPTSGSGNAVRAAYELGAKKVLGVEIDEKYYKDSVQMWLTVPH